MLVNETFTLNNGVKIPKLGFGTWQIPDSQAEEAVLNALNAGYRHIDTAQAYGNEAGVGDGLVSSGLHRDTVFVTSKIKAEIKSYEKAKKSIEQSLKELNTPYIDLMLIHAPKPWAEMAIHSPRKYYRQNLEVWRAMEEAYKEGKLKAIGVSNFAPDDLQNIIDHAEVKPMVNQIRFFISCVPEETLAYCQQNQILVEGYSPIATGRLLDNDKIKEIAGKYTVSLPQLCIRYVYQKGALPLPKSAHKDHIIENAKVDFEISESDMAYLDSLKKLVHLWF
jgi:diketogulonate reductase-like aldo/keto reductase